MIFSQPRECSTPRQRPTGPTNGIGDETENPKPYIVLLFYRYRNPESAVTSPSTDHALQPPMHQHRAQPERATGRIWRRGSSTYGGRATP
jgi:hypothetical protein